MLGTGTTPDFGFVARMSARGASRVGASTGGVNWGGVVACPVSAAASSNENSISFGSSGTASGILTAVRQYGHARLLPHKLSDTLSDLPQDGHGILKKI